MWRNIYILLIKFARDIAIKEHFTRALNWLVIKNLNTWGVVVRCSIAVNVTGSNLNTIAAEAGHPLVGADTAKVAHACLAYLNTPLLFKIIIYLGTATAADTLQIAGYLLQLHILPPAWLWQLAWLYYLVTSSLNGLFTLVIGFYKCKHNGIITTLNNTKIQRLYQVKVEIEQNIEASTIMTSY